MFFKNLKIISLVLTNIIFTYSVSLASNNDDCRNSSYYVKNIKVDLTKKSIVEARKLAEDKAKLFGLKTLLNKLTLRNKKIKFKNLEVLQLVDYLKINGPPQIIEEVREQIDSAGEDDVLGAGDGESDDDPMLKKAVEIIRTTKRASTSNLQRKLSIGYNRAARIMDELEDRGIVGPDLPGQGREILMDL